MKNQKPFAVIGLMFLLLSVWQLSPALCQAQIKKKNMKDKITKTLQSSDNPKELVTAALTLARSSSADDFQMLLELLRSENFLNRLYSKADYDDLSRKLRVRRVLEAVRDNPAADAHQILLKLIPSAAFHKRAARTDILIAVLAVIRPAPPKVVEFWDKHCQPDDGFTPVTIPAIIENGSEPALLLLEQKMKDARHHDEDKIGWMRSDILTHRNDAPLLESCRRLLVSDLAGNLKTALLEVIFDYRPEKWYRPAVSYQPPDRRKAGNAARQELHRIAEYARQNMTLEERLGEAMKETLKEIGQTIPADRDK